MRRSQFWFLGTIWVACLAAAIGGIALVGCSTGTESPAELDEPMAASIQPVAPNWAIDGSTFTCPGTSLPGNGVQNQPITIVLAPSLLAAGQENHPLRQAVRDLARDLKALVGNEPALASAPANAYNSIIVTMPDADPGNYHNATISGFEQHQITTKAVGSRTHVVLDGADLRGAIYAIYTFSEKTLGVPPLWYWMDWTPKPLGRGYLAFAANSCRTVAPAETKYRGVFFNNHAFFKGWQRPTGDDDPERISRLLETLHRLKINTFFDESKIDGVQYANARGLLGLYSIAALDRWDSTFNEADGSHPNADDVDIITTQPIDQWCPKDAYWQIVGGPNKQPPPGGGTSLGRFVHYWASEIQRVRSNTPGDVHWWLGLLGVRDNGQLFETSLDSQGWSVQEKGALLDEVSQCQLRLLLNASDDGNPATVEPYPRAVYHLWDEGNDFYASGSLTPGGMTISFGNTVRTHVPPPSLFNPGPGAITGYYQNLNMTSTGSHLVDGLGPWKAADGFLLAREKAASPLRFGLLNVGNFRPFLLSIAVISDLWWSTQNYPGATSGVERTLARHLPSMQSDITTLTTAYSTYLSNFWQQAPDDMSPLAGLQRRLPNRQYVWEDLRMRGAVNAVADAFADAYDTSKTNFDISDTADFYGEFDHVDPICPCSSSACANCANHTTATTFDEAMVRGLSMSNGAIFKWRSLLPTIEAIRARATGSEKTFIIDQFEVPTRTIIEAARANYFAIRAVQVFDKGASDHSASLTYLTSARQAIYNLRQELIASDHGVFQGFYANDCKGSKWAFDSLVTNLDKACTKLGGACVSDSIPCN